MTKVTPPFASETTALRRPTEQEMREGFGCGPADIALFNGLFHTIYRELKSLADDAGVEGKDADYNLLRDAVRAKIAAATGDSDTEDFVLLSQARARLPIHFEINSADNKINVSSPAAGTVRVPGGVSFTHRGIFQGTTSQTDFATSPNYNYHIRWRPDEGFVMIAHETPSYNPGMDPEDHPKFDSSFDDVLIARVNTNSSNIATIKTLRNAAKLKEVRSDGYTSPANAGENFASFNFDFPLDWARTPDHTSLIKTQSGNPTGGAANYTDNDTAFKTFGPGGDINALSNLYRMPTNRYGLKFRYMDDGMTNVRFEASFLAV